MKGECIMKNIFSIILIVCAIHAAYAGKFYVQQTAAAGGNGLAWTSAFSDLQPALEAAQSGDSILVGKGVYMPSKDAAAVAAPQDPRTRTFSVKTGVRLYGGFAGNEPDMAGRNPASNRTVVSGDLGIPDSSADNAYHVVTGASTAVIDGFTIIAGNANGSAENAQSGAIFKCDGMTIAGCNITGNSALFGGAFSVVGESPVQVVNCTFTANRASNVGAAVNITASTSVVSFANTVFRHNFSASNGALYNSGASPVFTNCIFDSNFTAASPYGLYSDGGNPQLVNCVVYNDQLFCSSAQSSQIVISNSIIGGNSGIAGSATVTYSCLPVARTGTGNIYGDPMFVDVQAGDFRLRTGSPCIDKANGAVAPALDFDGKPRFDYPTIGNVDQMFADIGAFECTTPNIAPVITAAHVSGGFLDEPITIALDSLEIQDNDNAYPEDFTLIVGTGRFTRVATAKTYVTIKAVADTASEIAVPLRVRDLIDTSAEYMIYIPVKRRVVYVDAAAAGLNNGSSWKNAFPTLAAAIKTTASSSEIWVAKGTYVPAYPDTGKPRTKTFSLVSGGAPLYGGFLGTETDKSQRNVRLNESILSGDIGIAGDLSDNCFHVVTGANNAVLDGFVITGGNADSIVAASSTPLLDYACGGGLYNNMVSPSVSNCTFRGNYALGGGAVYNYRGSSPKLLNCIFCFNTATDTALGKLTDRRGGGAIFNNWSCAPTITNCLFYRNSVTANGWGAAIYHYWGNVMNVVNCTFFDNSDPGNTRTGFAVEWGDASLKNSIIHNTTIGNLDNRGPTVATYTCFPPGMVLSGTGNIFVVPNFVDTAANDFHLKSNSLCIDQASGTLAPQLDFDGKARYDHPGCDNVDGSFADMGAYEYRPIATLARPEHEAPIGSDRSSLELSATHASGASIFISYAVPVSIGMQNVHFSIFDLRGVRIAKRTIKAQGAGSVVMNIGAGNGFRGSPARGFYFCRLEAGNLVTVKKVAMLR